MNDQRNDGTGQSGDSSRGQQASHDHARSLSRLTELARRELPPEPSANESAAAYHRFAGAAAPARRVVFLRWAGLPLAAVAVVVVAALGIWRLTAPAVAPLGLTVAGGSLEEGGFVRASVSSKPNLRFSDGTEVSLGPSSRARVTETTGNGARVLLEEGRADARVVARKGAEWVFDAGPCRIHVTGTRFDMIWSAREQILEVRLHHGGVTVKGPPAMAGVPMRPGQRLVMNVRQRSVALTDLVPEASAWSPPSPTLPTLPETAPSNPAPGTSPPAGGAIGGARRGDSSSSLSSSSSSSWPARVLAGEFRSVTEEAERRGIEDVLRGESAANLMALADAARYADAFTLAHKALLKVRARFPRTAPAHKAAFLLGRMAEDQHGNLGQALQWYDTYLADAPDDAFRAEAMGRRMTATLRLSGAAQARSFASEYLRRYPQGAYAQAARAILTP